MTRFAQRPLFVALATVLGLATLAPVAHAQQDTAAPTMREQRAKRMAELGKGKEEAKEAEQKPAQYPNATRVSPLPMPICGEYTASPCRMVPPRSPIQGLRGGGPRAPLARR